MVDPRSTMTHAVDAVRSATRGAPTGGSSEGKDREPHRSPWLALTVVLVGSYAAALNNSLLGVALPSIARDLETAAGGLGVDWVVTAFLLGVVLVQPATAWFADRWGRTTAYAWSLALFGVGAMFCALAPTMPILVGGRFVQGLGGGAVMPIGMTIVYERFPPHRRGTALGIWGIGIAGAPAAGPPLGGLIVSTVGWRWLFVIFIVVAIVATLLAAYVLDDSGFRNAQPLDVGGWTLAAVGVVTLVIVSRQAPSWGMASPMTVVTAVASAGSFAVLVRRSLRRSNPIIEFRLFTNTSFSIALLATGLLGIGQLARANYVPIELQVVRGFDALEVGVILAPAAIGIALAMPIGGWLADRVGTRVPTMIGFACVAMTMWLLSRLDAGHSAGHITRILVLQGVGTGFAYVPTTVAAMNSVAARYVAQASALKNLDRQFAGAIGVAVLGAILVADLGAVAPSSVDAVSAQSAYNNIFVVATWISVVGLVVAALMPGRSVTKAQHARRASEQSTPSSGAVGRHDPAHELDAPWA